MMKLYYFPPLCGYTDHNCSKFREYLKRWQAKAITKVLMLVYNIWCCKDISNRLILLKTVIAF
jgi:hypothetical protein